MGERARSPLRLLAPLALIAFGFALFLVVSGSDVEEEPTSTARQSQESDLGETETSPPATEQTDEEDREARLPDDNYVVKSGDTLAAIAEKTGVPVERLQDLNPDLDPQALVSGQKIKLRE